MRVSKQPARAYTRIIVALITGLIIGVIAALLGSLKVAPLLTWDTLILTYVIWVWLTIWPRTAQQSKQLAQREDPSRRLTDTLLTVAALASLVGVALIIVQASNSNGAQKGLLAGLGVLSVTLSWLLIHTIYTLKYAEMYYANPAGGINFNQSEPPQYSDFAYLSFTIGMTFQVSDTDLKTSRIRKTALHQAHLSYLFGTIIIASTINLLVSLSN